MPEYLRFQKKYFFKLFGIIFVISCLTFFITLYTIFYISGTSRAESYQKDISDSLNASAQAFSSLLNETGMLYTIIRSNELVRSFFQSGDIPPGIDAFLRNISALNPYIESVALYRNGNEAYLYSGSYYIDMRLFLGTYLGNMAQWNTYMSTPFRYRLLFRFAPSPADEENDINLQSWVVGIMYYMIDMEENKSNCIVVNLNSFKLSELLFGNFEGTGFLLNEYGTVVCVGGAGPPPPLLQRVRWSQRIVQDPARTGRFDTGKAGGDNFVMYYKLFDASWVLYRMFDNPHFTFYGDIMLPYLILVIMAALVFSMLITFFISSRLYKPIKGIMNRLGVESPYLIHDFHKARDEFAYINTMFTNLSNKVAVLEAEKTGFLSEAKGHFLKSVLVNDGGEDINEKNWLLYGFKVVPENLFISVVKWDEEDDADFNGGSFEDLIRESTLHCLAGGYRIETVAVGKGEVALLMNALRESPGSTSEAAADLERFHDFVCNSAKVRISVSIGFGGRALDINGCAACYRSALDLLKQRFVFGYGKIITVEYVEANLSGNLEYPGELIAKLERNIREANKKSFLTNYNRLLDILSKHIYQETAPVLLQVITRCLSAMNSISANNISIKVDFDEFDAIFSTMHTLEHTYDWFSRILDEYLLAVQNMDHFKGDKYHHIYTQIQNYVREHFADPNLNVDSLADIFGYTSHYISRIYKNFSGGYLHDYIRNIRIERARELLKNTDHSIHEISIMTGFSNYNYFFSSFKKQTGLTPTVYRSRFIIVREKGCLPE